jgi:hypothetical protein
VQESFFSNGGFNGPGSDEERLKALLTAYRDACGDPEPSANFMPQLWQRIEKAQTFTLSFRRMARGFVTAAAALSLVMVAIGIQSPSTRQPASGLGYSATYVEVLAAQQTEGDYFESATTELPDDLEQL